MRAPAHSDHSNSRRPLSFSLLFSLSLQHSSFELVFAFPKYSRRRRPNPRLCSPFELLGHVGLGLQWGVQRGCSLQRAAFTEIIVIRHGETEWNVDGRIQGHLDAKLNEEGRRQAAAVADRLRQEPQISAVYSSDLKRAFETAQTIAAACGGLEV